MLTYSPEELVTLFAQAACEKGLFEKEDQSYYVNRLMEAMQVDAPVKAEGQYEILDIAQAICDQMVHRGLVEDRAEAREQFLSALFGIVTLCPECIRHRFVQIEEKQGIDEATGWFYRYCRDNDYIRTRCIANNLYFTADTPAGTLEITINLSKPEKDPRDIAAALKKKSTDYPKCMLCVENPGYQGRDGFPARQNHRMIPLTLQGESWYFQYSPYLYYQEHCIILNAAHTPMRMTAETFLKMKDFVDRFPHYLVGSNADLPIVGGSILTHDHFQGGKHVFPMENAKSQFTFNLSSGIQADVLSWPLTCLRIKGRDGQAVAEAGYKILTFWRNYSDEACGIYAETKGVPHNAITPVMRKEEGVYTLYLMLRNNLTTQEHPMGVFHPHADKHHIKKENIGLIEAMGLFILPGRLKSEIQDIIDRLATHEPLDPENVHTPWAMEAIGNHPPFASKKEVVEVIDAAIGHTCYQVLCDAGVYKQDEQGRRGIERLIQALKQI